MKIIIDVGHPADLHLFKNFALEMQRKGHQVLFTCREMEFAPKLLIKNHLNFISFGKRYNSIIGKLLGIVQFGIREFITCLKFKPDILLSHGSIYAAHAAFILRIPHIALEDTFNLEQVRLYFPFTKYLLTGNYSHPMKSEKVIKYAGYHELAYLHPNYFTPDKSVLKDLGVKEGEAYVIMRFSSWQASHDIGRKGLSLGAKREAIRAFSQFAKVFISSEATPPDEFKKYMLSIAPDKMHDALAFCSFLWGETYTMPAECSVLGVPSIIVHTPAALYLKQQEDDYSLCYNFSDSDEGQQKSISKGIELLQTPDLKETWKKKRDKMLEDKIDVTAFLVWFIENFPESKMIMKDNPEYQYRFK